MAPINYPIHIRRNFNRRWNALFAQKAPRNSPPEGTDTCRCGDVVTAPSASFHTTLLVVNEWRCSRCGERWQTMARCAGNDNGK
jgi:hypothetical protein